MKKVFFISTILILNVTSIFAQSTLKIFTDLTEETAKFKVFLNGEALDAVHSADFESDELVSGNYELRIMFNTDTIADCVKKITIPSSGIVTHKVIRMKKFRKESGKMGRSVGRRTGNTGEDDQKNLVEVYKLELQE